MKKRNATAALEAVARRNNTTVEEVRREIAHAIAIGQSSPDPQVRELWRTIPRQGTQPTPEEVIGFLAGRVYSSFSGL